MKAVHYGAAVFALAVAAPARADKPAPLSPQTLKLPSGPSSLKGLGESFSADAASGTGSFSVPVEVPPGFLAPKVQLSYSGGHGKSEVGSGWRLTRFRIYRTTDKGLPHFDLSDRFGVEGPGLNDELVAVDPAKHYYRLKNEGAFALFVWDVANNRWIIHMKGGETAYLGESDASRESNARGTYRWYVARQIDRFTHSTEFTYERDERHLYLRQIDYQLHAATQYQNHVVFTYEDRPDAFTDYTYGAAETTARRLARIETFHGSRRMRSYTLRYEEALLSSLLVGVDMEGEGGLHMPALTFGYAPHSDQGGPLVVMQSAPPLEGLLNGQGTLEDVNGDGLPDLLVGDAGNYRYYENLDGKAWSDTPISLANSPDAGLADPGVIMVDADGDGFRDVLIPHYNSFRYYPASNIRNGIFGGYGEPVTLEPESTWTFDWTSSLVKVTDLNADGRIDLLYQRPGALSQVVNAPTNQLEESALPELPLDVDFEDPRVQLLDYNGDGVLDLVRKDITYDRGSVRVWFGLGWGLYAEEQSMFGVPSGDGSEFYLQDVNGDGQTDLLRISGSDVVYYLNDGNLAFTAPKGDYRGLPETYQASKILFADMNGNGTTDIVWVTTDFELKYIDLMVQPFFGLLTRIDNGMGMVTSITYRSSTEYLVEAKAAGNPWKTPIVRGQPVIAEMRVSDSMDLLGLEANVTSTTYDYRDGYYDPKEREFRGFAKVVTTEAGDDFAAPKITHTWFHVGRNLVTGEDEEILKGKPYMQTVIGGDGKTIASTETRWERRWLCQEDLGAGTATILPQCSRYGDKQASKDSLVAFAVQTGVLQGSWEKTTRPRYTFTESDVDAWGNETLKLAYGEVKLVGAHRLGDPLDVTRMDVRGCYGGECPEDEARTEATFINNASVSAWLIGLPLESKLGTLGGATLRHSRVYYDGPDYVGLPLGVAERGKATREESCLGDCGLGGDGRWIANKRSAYDNHGQLVGTMDANDNLHEYLYDAETDMFLVDERVYVEAGPLDYTATYDRGLGAIVTATDFNGNLSRFEYDGLGRLTKVIDPLGTSDTPLHRYGYEYGTAEYPVSTTTQESRVADAAYQRSWIYSDGLGRQRLTKVEAELPHQFVGSGWQRLSARGTATHTYESFASASAAFQAAPTGTPVTVSYYDELGRAEAVYPPDVGYGKTYRATTFVPFETRVYDERDTYERTWKYPAITAQDGLGRTAEIVKYNDYDSVFTELRWTVSYNAAGDITRLVDPAGNEREYEYDTLGRRTLVDDPNAGLIRYEYDDAGNLVSRVDALGQETASEYGLANRLLATHLRNDVNGRPDATYAFHYDAAAGFMSDATNLKGQLAWIEDGISRTHWSYDEQNRAVVMVRELWDPARSTESAQERDTFRVDYTLDPQGKVLSASLPGAMQLTYQYNARGLLSGIIANDAPLVAALRYTPAGKPARTDYGNGITACAWYDVRQRLAGTKVEPSAPDSCVDASVTSTAALQHVRYSFSPDGLIKGITDLTVERNEVPRLDAAYSYDRLYELTSATAPEGTVTYAYDAIQNLIRRTGDPSIGEFPLGDFEYGEGGAGPNAITSAGDESFVYDGAGRMLNYQGFALTYDAGNRLVEARRADGTRLRWWYDFGGEPLAKVYERPGREAEVYRYVFDGYQERHGEPTWVVSARATKVAEIVETDGIVPSLYTLDDLIKYRWNPSARPKPAAAELLDFDGDGDAVDGADLAVAARRMWAESAAGGSPVRSVRYYHEDQLGSPTHVTDSRGNWVSLTRFYLYGAERTERGAQPLYGFASGEREPETELGLQRFGARWYAPRLGRWTSPDPLFANDADITLEEPLQSGAYSYCRNNPVLLADPPGTLAGPLPEVIQEAPRIVQESPPPVKVAVALIVLAILLGDTVGLPPGPPVTLPRNEDVRERYEHDGGDARNHAITDSKGEFNVPKKEKKTPEQELREKLGRNPTKKELANYENEVKQQKEREAAEVDTPSRSDRSMEKIKGGHHTNKRGSSRETHQQGQSRRKRDQGGEKGDARRKW